MRVAGRIKAKGEYCHERRKDLCKPRVLRVVLIYEAVDYAMPDNCLTTPV